MDNLIKEKIELATEAIFNVLYYEGDMDLKDLKKNIDAHSDLIDMAVGALVARDDIELLERGESVIVHRNEPSSAVFPLRGNEYGRG
jgi:hypothetical protein